MIDHLGERKNQVAILDSFESDASVGTDDPHKRIFLGASFFYPRYRYAQAATLIHEVSHTILDTHDFFYNYGPDREIPDPAGLTQHANLFANIQYMMHDTTQTVDNLSAYRLEGGRDQFSYDTGQVQPYDYNLAVQNFKDNRKLRVKLMLQNSDSIANLGVILATPELLVGYQHNK